MRPSALWGLEGLLAQQAPGAPRGTCPDLKSFLSSEPLMTCTEPTLFFGSSFDDAA